MAVGKAGENCHFVRAWKIIAPFGAAEQETCLSSYVTGQTLKVKFYEARIIFELELWTLSHTVCCYLCAFGII